MQAQLAAVLDELKRLKRQGVTSVYITDDTLDLVRQWQRPAAVDDTTTAPTFQAAVSEPEEPKRPAKPAPPPEPAFKVAPIPEPPTIELPAGDKQAQWEWLRDRVLNCPACNEHTRIDMGKKVVFGVGSVEADIFFCGEAPGADEEEQGEPFVGKAGELLTKIIQAMGLKREDVYIANILNWRPEKENMDVGNRPPTQEEMDFCLPYLRAQVEVVKPKVIVALGKTAISGLLCQPPAKLRMASMRGQWLDFEGTPLMPTFHPSYVLRYASPKVKRQVWEDMLLVMEKVGLPISERQRGFFKKG